MEGWLNSSMFYGAWVLTRHFVEPAGLWFLRRREMKPLSCSYLLSSENSLPSECITSKKCLSLSHVPDVRKPEMGGRDHLAYALAHTLVSFLKKEKVFTAVDGRIGCWACVRGSKRPMACFGSRPFLPNTSGHFLSSDSVAVIVMSAHAENTLVSHSKHTESHYDVNKPTWSGKTNFYSLWRMMSTVAVGELWVSDFVTTCLPGYKENKSHIKIGATH